MGLFDKLVLKTLRRLAVKYGIERLVTAHFDVAMTAYTNEIDESGDDYKAVRAAITRFVDHIV